MIRVTQFLRRSCAGAYSLERLYQDVRNHLPADIQVETRTNRHFSRGFFRRVWDAVAAVGSQSDVNHITGDVHYLAYFLDQRRTILTILDCIPLERSDGIRFWVLWFFWYWLPEKRCAAIAVISEATRQQVLRYVRCDPEKVRVIHCNVSDEFQASASTFDSHCPRILHVGTTVNKNLEAHAAALEDIRCRLVIIGQLSESQISALDRYHIQYDSLSGLSRDALVAEYRRCDLLLFASVYEGFGLPIIEAQAIGRPVVTSDLLSMPEVAGEGACLVNPFDVASIRAGVQRVISDPGYREDLISKGFDNVKRFSTSLIAEQYAALYREVHQRSLAERR